MAFRSCWPWRTPPEATCTEEYVFLANKTDLSSYLHYFLVLGYWPKQTNFYVETKKQTNWIVLSLRSDLTLMVKIVFAYIYSRMNKTQCQNNMAYHMQSMMPGQWYKQKLFWWNTSKVLCYQRPYKGWGTSGCMAWMALFRPANTCNVLFYRQYT
jgi:hypothetical protein